MNSVDKCSRAESICKRAALKNFAEFTRKYSRLNTYTRVSFSIKEIHLKEALAQGSDGFTRNFLKVLENLFS